MRRDQISSAFTPCNNGQPKISFGEIFRFSQQPEEPGQIFSVSTKEN